MGIHDVGRSSFTSGMRWIHAVSFVIVQQGSSQLPRAVGMDRLRNKVKLPEGTTDYHWRVVVGPRASGAWSCRTLGLRIDWRRGWSSLGFPVFLLRLVGGSGNTAWR